MPASIEDSAGRSNRPARLCLANGFLAFAAAAALVPSPALAQAARSDVQAELRAATTADRELRAFYESRDHRPLWVRGSSLGPEADLLLKLIETADADGLDPADYRPQTLASAIDTARRGAPADLARAEMLLSQTFAAFARDMRRPSDVDMVYVDPVLKPTVPSISSVLKSAVAAPSLGRHLDSIGWMHPFYGQLRKTLLDSPSDGKREQQLRVNLERARALPADPGRRYILVDAAAARLWMYEDGRVRDSMKVVVGKADQQTPMMAGLIRFAMVNPYWNIPPDLVQVRVAPDVISSGLSYLDTRRFQVMSGWSEAATVVDPAEVDWKAVAAGRKEVAVRQLPGGDNAMGKMKFMFPNHLGVYLHDTPEKHLLLKADRRFSSGCVRVEDAERLARWLFGKPLAPESERPEQRVDLPEPVPVIITYFTAAPEEGRIVYRPDPYNRDAVQMARLGSRSLATR